MTCNIISRQKTVNILKTDFPNNFSNQYKFLNRVPDSTILLKTGAKLLKYEDNNFAIYGYHWDGEDVKHYFKGGAQ